MPTAWRCDLCAGEVHRDGGLLTFRTQQEPPYSVHAFRIVHATCGSAGAGEVAGEPLAACVDQDGLSLLLAFLSAGPGRRGDPGLAVSDIDEFVDLVRRLHVPFYERARHRFGDPQVERSMRLTDRARPYQTPALRPLADI